MEDEESWSISMHTPDRIMKARKMLSDLGYANPFGLAVEFDGDVAAAIESVFVKPVVSGEKYIPAPTKIDNGLTEEQEARCIKGRWMQEQVNAVFSVAHSKTQPSQPELQDAAQEPVVLDLPVVQLESHSSSSSLQDSYEKSPLQHSQSETPL